MAVTPSQIRDYAPQFTTLVNDSPAVVQTFIDLAEKQVNRVAWGSKADEGVILLTLHKLTLRARGIANGETGNGAGGAGGVVGAVKRVKIDNLETEYATSSSTSGGVNIAGLSAADAALAQTQYGLDYMAMRSLVFAPRASCVGGIGYIPRPWW